MESSLMATLPSPTSKRFDITIAGETNMDLILYGLPEQMEVDRELLASGFQVTLGGSSSILAHNLAVLGSKVGFVTELGGDELGEIAFRRLSETGLDLSQVTYKTDKTTGVTVILPHGQRRRILTNLGVMAEMKVDDLDLNYLTAARHFHLSSLFLQTGLQPDLPKLFSTLKQAGLTISLDTNDDPADQWGGVLHELLHRIDILLPNEDEIKRITGKATVEHALDSLAGVIPLIVVKCGRRGAVVQQGATRTWIEPLTVDPVDTIGAGDSFNAGFLHAYLQGKSPSTAAAMGNVSGALSTLRCGGTEAFRDHALREDFLKIHRTR
jgi:sugar/nucleoside kinase (ribokinase family)